MKILVLGAGLSGATIARRLTDRGHKVEVYERDHVVGGLAQTWTSLQGIHYEPYGNHYFHTNDREVWDFVSQYTEWGSYKHTKGIIVADQLYPYPLTHADVAAITKLGFIRQERPLAPRNASELKKQGQARFGNVVFRRVIECYSRKMWGQFYNTLDPTDVMKRLEIRDKPGPAFLDIYQGMPRSGYTELVQNTLMGVRTVLGSPFEGVPNGYDVTVSTIPISNRLPYRSIDFETCDIDEDMWENPQYGVINLPDHPTMIRKANYNIIYDVPSTDDTILAQYQTPCDPSYACPPMYPIRTSAAESMFQAVLTKVVSDGVCPAGRLGLYRYLNMDQAVRTSLDLVSIVEAFPDMSPGDRTSAINRVRDSID